MKVFGSVLRGVVLKSYIPIFAAFISNFIWGSTFLASKIILSVVDPLVATIFRFLVAVIIMFLVGFFRREGFQLNLLKRRLTAIISLGLIGYVGLYYFQMVGLSTISSSQSAAIMLLAPIITLFVNAFLDKKLIMREVLVIFVCFVGAYFILVDAKSVQYTRVETIGVILTMIASACLGISVVQTKKLLQPNAKGDVGFSVFNLTFYSICIGLIGLVVIAVLEGRQFTPLNALDPKTIGWLLYLGIVCSVLAFFFWNWAIKHTRPAVAAGAMYVKTPVALALGAYVLSENLSLTFYFGSLVILVTLVLNQFIYSRVK